MDRAQVKLIVEKHADGYVAYPLGLKGVVVGQGDTHEDAVADVKSPIAFHVEYVMKTNSVCDLQKPTRSVVATGQNGQVAITGDDQRIAVVLGMQGLDRETVAVETSRSFWNEIAQRRTHQTISFAEIRKQLGT